MTSISTSGSSIIFTFEDSPYYLNNGSIECPKNSLALIVDSSEMATFKKAGADDIFLSIKYDDLGMTKDELIEYYQENMTGGGGSAEEIQELSGKVSTLSGTVTSHTSNNDIHVTTQDKSYWDGKADASDLSTLSGTVTGLSSDVSTLSGTVTGLSSDVSTLSGTVTGISTDVSTLSGTVTGLSSDVSTLSGTVTGISSDVSTLSGTVTGLSSDVSTLSGTVTGLSSDVSTLSGTVTSHTSNSDIHVTSQDKTNWDGKADASDLSTLSGTVTGLSSDVSTLSGTVTGISNDVSTISGTVTGLSSDVSTLSGTVTSHTSNSDIHVTSTDKTNWDGAVTALGGVKLVKITQSAYDQLQTKDPDTLYIITES